MTEPLVSVVITTYNTGRYLPETLASVFAQTYGNYEVIVVDDGSEDDSVARAREFDDHITLLTRAHEGLGPARNAGMDRASGEYLAFLDSDDLWDPETLRTQVSVARHHPESGLIVADGMHHQAPHIERQRLFGVELAEQVDAAPTGEVTDRFYRVLVWGNVVKCPAQTLVPRWAVTATGPVCVTPNGPQDYDYYLRLARGYPVTFHRASLTRWRYRTDSMSGGVEERNLRWASQAIEVLDRERNECPAGDQDVFDAALAAQVREAVHVVLYARMRGVSFHPDDMSRLANARPRDPRVLAARALLALPVPVGRAVLRGARSTLDLTRRVRATPTR